MTICVLNAHNLLGHVQQIDRGVLQIVTLQQYCSQLHLLALQKFLDQESLPDAASGEQMIIKYRHKFPLKLEHPAMPPRAQLANSRCSSCLTLDSAATYSSFFFLGALIVGSSVRGLTKVRPTNLRASSMMTTGLAKSRTRAHSLRERGTMEKMEARTGT